MTFTYKLYQYTNGLGESVWCAKERGFLWLNWWVTWGDLTGRCMIDGPSAEWVTREDAVRRLTAYSQHKLAKRESHKTAAQRSKLTLVLIEDVQV